MTADALGALLKAQPVGKVMWVAVRGRSMRPLLTGGESLKVKRCAPESLKRGEIAVLLRADGALISHLVVATAPVATASMDGKRDPAGLEPLARATSIRRGKVVVPVPPRLALLGLHAAWSAATRGTVTRAAYALAGNAVASPRTAKLRTLLGAVTLDLVGPDTLKPFAVALSRWETLPADTLESLVRAGVVVAAFRRGAIVGCVCVGPDRVLRHAWLQHRAQGLDLEAVMLDRLVREAKARGLEPTRAEVSATQKGFIAAVKEFALDHQEI